MSVQPSSTAELPQLPARISKDEINQLPLVRFGGKIHVVREEKDLAVAARKIRNAEVLGFDVESKPTFRKGESHPVALLQLATSNEAFLIQLQNIENLGPVQEILENPDIGKTGVAIRDDVKKLFEKYPFNPEGFVELSHWASKLGIVTTGLRSLTAIFLGKRISKGAQLSNWERSKLAPSQLLYAATDAWISRELHLAMKRHMEALEKEPS